MSWLSDWLSHQGAVGNTLNAVGGPLVKAAGSMVKGIPVVGGVVQGLEDLGGAVPGGMNSGGVPGGSGGLTAQDILHLVGGAGSAAANYMGNQAGIAERQREYNRTTGDTEGQMAVGVQNRLNTAPMADNAQYLLMSKLGAPPTAFHPRDITQPGGANNLNTPATGGAADQLAANQAASAKYTPGAGGVDTSALQLLLQKLKGSAYGSPSAMPSPSPTMNG